MRTIITFVALVLFSVPAFADVAVDPCEGAETGAACTTDSGATGTCDASGACVATAANNTTGGTNNATTGDTNNAPPANSNNQTNAANNQTGETTGNTSGDEKKEDDKGCSTVGGAGLLPSLLVFALVFVRRRW